MRVHAYTRDKCISHVCVVYYVVFVRFLCVYVFFLYYYFFFCRVSLVAIRVLFMVLLRDIGVTLLTLRRHFLRCCHSCSVLWCLLYEFVYVWSCMCACAFAFSPYLFSFAYVCCWRFFCFCFCFFLCFSLRVCFSPFFLR